MDNKRILSLLGLALRGGNLAVGEEPVEAAARAKDARVLLLAADAADNTRRRAEHFAQAGQCIWIRAPFTKAELGRAMGRTSVALAAVTDVGLANAVVRRMAELDPVRYGGAAAQLEVKARRAAERRAERLAHEKNVRRGKRKRAGPREKAPAGASSAGSEKKPVPARRAGSRPGENKRPGPGARANPYARSHPVKKGKGSFRK